MGAGKWITGLLGATALGAYIFKGFNPTITVERNGSSCYPDGKYQLDVTVGRLLSKRKIGLTVTKQNGSLFLAPKPSMFGEVWLEPSNETIPTCATTEIKNGQADNTSYGLTIPKTVNVVYLNPVTKKKTILKTIQNSSF